LYRLERADSRNRAKEQTRKLQETLIKWALLVGDPSRTEICNNLSGLFWQTCLTASIEVKALYALLANRAGVLHASAA
jgi:hypothetical protein